MELTVTQENFARALSNVTRVASTRTQLPILSNILLRTDGNQLLVAAMDLEMATQQLIGAKIIQPGSITIPAKLISEFVSSLPKGPVELKVDGNHLRIKSGKFIATINGVSAEDYPELPTIDEKIAISYNIAIDDFKQAVNQTIITAGNDPARPILTGVYWHSFDGFLYMAATDGYRLSERKVVETVSEVAAIIPTNSLREVLRSLTDDLESIDILFDEEQVRFRAGDVEITSQLVNGNFPDYRKLIPASSETEVKINKAEFIRITKIAGLFARNSGGSITLLADSEKSNFSISSVASQLGENTSEASAEITSDGEVTLNSSYLLEALNATEGEEVTFSFSGKMSPCVVRGVTKNPNYLHIIMPVKS